MLHSVNDLLRSLFKGLRVDVIILKKCIHAKVVRISGRRLNHGDLRIGLVCISRFRQGVLIFRIGRNFE